MKKKVFIETLGCSRNQVDSEMISGLLANKKYEILNNPEIADFIIVNTCGFIEDAINQSIDTILELAEFKKNGTCESLIVAGCLPQRFQKDLVDSLPEVDLFIGTASYFQIGDILDSIIDKKNENFKGFPDPASCRIMDHSTPRVVSTYPYSYLKIAEGCARHCTYCIIPDLRGPLRSRSVKDIVEEAKKLAEKGIKEIVLVSQETTDYGRDLGENTDLSVLLENLSDISQNIWIRFMYGHPLSLSDRLMDVVKSRENICSYFDIPVQHASDSILKKMGRGYKSSFAEDLFMKIRSEIKNAALRTTLITGFPGEKDEDFKELADFMGRVKFDHAGVFTYSEMEDIPSFRLPDKVDPETAEERKTILMEKQAAISQERNNLHLDEVVAVLVEGGGEDDFFVGRTMFQAPEVDGVTYIDGSGVVAGDIVKVRITDSFDYDLAGNLE